MHGVVTPLARLSFDDAHSIIAEMVLAFVICMQDGTTLTRRLVSRIAVALSSHLSPVMPDLITVIARVVPSGAANSTPKESLWRLRSS